jgi:hypothetical protein
MDQSDSSSGINIGATSTTDENSSGILEISTNSYNSDRSVPDSDEEKLLTPEVKESRRLKRESAIIGTPSVLSIPKPYIFESDTESDLEGLTLEMNPYIFDYEDEIELFKYKIYLDKFPRFDVTTKWSVVENRTLRQDNCTFCKTNDLCKKLCPRRWMKNGVNVHPVMVVIPLDIFNPEIGSLAKMIFSDDKAFLDNVLASKTLNLEFGTVDDFLTLGRKVTDASGEKIIPDRDWLKSCRNIENAALIPKIWLKTVPTIREFKIRQNDLEN